MSGFVTAPTVVPPGVPAAETTIANDGFFPDIDPAKLRLQARIAESVLFDRLREAVLGAIVALDLDLADWRATQIAAGYATLAAVPGPMLGGEKRWVILYRRALNAQIKVELVEKMRDIDTTAAGDRRLEALDPSIDDLRRDARYAIRDFLGTPRLNAELI